MQYMKRTLSPVERKNSWQPAEAAEEKDPYRIRYLLGKADWDPDAMRDDLIEYMGITFRILMGSLWWMRRDS